jgi:hypothetical protein
MATTIKVSAPVGKRGGMVVVSRVAQSNIKTLENGDTVTSVTLGGKTVRVIKQKRKKLFQLA